MERISHVNVFAQDCKFYEAEVYTEGEIISEVTLHGGSVEGLDYLLPGFVDTHLHGAVAADFSDGSMEGMKKIAEYELKNGITSICPATMTIPVEELYTICDSYKQYKALPCKIGAEYLGFYLEGPFISAQKCGAQRTDCLKLPDIELFEELQRLSQNGIRICLVAPELKGSREFIRQIKEKYVGEVVVSLGHTIAEENQAKQALEEGAKRLTHFYNAMKNYDQIAKAALPWKDCFSEIICDGKHNSKERIYHAFELFGPDRVLFISDSMRATGLGDGSYTLGGQTVMVSGRDAMLLNGTRAGSVCNLYDCFLTAVSMGIPLEDVVKAVTVNPAKSLGLENYIGSIRPGMQADLLLLNSKLQLQRIMKKGKYL